jgi:hypothetical protein
MELGHVHDSFWEIETLYTPPFVYKVQTLLTYGVVNYLEPNIVTKRCFVYCIRV